MSTYLPGDIYSRYCKLRGFDSLFVCATDEHGAPIEINAAKAGKKPEDFVKEYHDKQEADLKKLGIDFDVFYHTHSEENKEFAELFFSEIKKKDGIFEKEVEQLYCENDKRFLPDRYVKGNCPFCGAEDQYGDGCEKCGRVYSTTDLVNPYCSICRTAPIRRKSKHFFFKLSSQSSFLKEWFSDNKNLPKDVVSYLDNWIKEGLQDWDITRDGPYFGIKIPGVEEKYFYVWFDAPIAYISSTAHYCREHGKRWEDYWKNDKSERVHFIGKDIQYFHFLFWPSMLKLAGYSLPTRIPTRGWLTVDGEKMSKSRGTFILLEEFLYDYPADYLRYYYASITPNSIADANWDSKEFEAKVNNELIDSYGNYVYRVLYFLQAKLGGEVPEPSSLSDAERDFSKKIDALAPELEKHFEECEFKVALEKCMLFSQECNRYFNSRAPWRLLKEGKKKEAETVLYYSLKGILSLSIALHPFVPFTTAKVFLQVGVNKQGMKWGDYSGLKVGNKLPVPEILFQKIEKRKENA